MQKVVLSLFDGMSCGQIALKELGHDFVYYASEVDKFAIQQTKHNFPGTIQLGDVTKIDVSKLPKIDLLIGGSPCTGFSFAGKQLNFNDPQSKLFFEFVRIKNELQKINPDLLFLLENVNMKKEYMRVISEHIGVFPVNVNSNLVSPQNRNRWYWTNIRTKRIGFDDALWSDIPQPKDRGIFLKDILQDESEIDEKYYLKDKEIDRGIKKHQAQTWHTGNKMGAVDFPTNPDKKAKCVTAMQIPGDRSVNHVRIIKLDKLLNKKADQNKIDKKYYYSKKMIAWIGKHEKRTGKKLRIYNGNDKFQCLEATMYKKCSSQRFFSIGKGLRYITPTECARLQTVPTWYKWIVSDTQAYKMLGNGFTIEVIKHILSFIKWQ